MKNVISLMVSSDWHIGATDPYRFKKELMSLVQDTIKQKKSLDLFIVSGDTFDMKEYLSSESVKVFFLIMTELLEITEKYNTQFRFIEGTRTHDALQLGTLKIIFEDLLQNNRVKFIEEVTTEELLGLNILYIPEEYIIYKELYYEKYFNSEYDFIFGHGNTDLMWYMKNTKQLKTSSAPVFTSEELMKISRFTYFGHFHYRIEVGNGISKFRSIGPVTRWEFGKEDECGLYYIEYDKTTKIGIEYYIENIYAPILPTIKFNISKKYDIGILAKEINKRIGRVKEIADKIRLIITIDTSVDNYITMRDFILSSYGNIDKLNLNIKMIGGKETEAVEETINDSVEEKPYLYDKSMHDEARIAAFIRKKEGVNISIENILEVIQKKDTKIGIREE